MKTLHFIVMTCLLMFATSANAVEQITYYHSDAAGSPIAATDDSGNLLWNQAYDAWGSPIPSPSGDPRGFTGASRDLDTGLSDLQARWYSPELGRMLAMDPVRFHDGNIQSFNLYAYGNNNPFRYEDPNGEAPSDVFIEGVPALGKSLGAWGAIIVGRYTDNWALYYAGQDGLNELRADNIAALAASAAPPGSSTVARIAKQSDNIPSNLGGTFEIIDGVRRSKAADLVGNKTVKATVLDDRDNVIGIQDISISDLRSPNKSIIDLSDNQKMDRFMDTLNRTKAGSEPPPILVRRGDRGVSVRDIELTP